MPALVKQYRQFLDNPPAVLGREVVGPECCVAGEALRWITGDLLDAVADVGDAEVAAGSHRVRHDRQRLEQQGQLLRGLVQGLDGFFPPGYINQIPFIIERGAAAIPDCPGRDRHRNDGAVLAAQLGFKLDHPTLLLKQSVESPAVVGRHIGLGSDVRDRREQFDGRRIAQQLGHGGIDAVVAAFRRRLKHAFDRILKNGPVFFFGRGHILQLADNLPGHFIEDLGERLEFGIGLIAVYPFELP